MSAAASRSREGRDMERVVVARIRRAHGLHGALFIQPETDHAEEVFAAGRVLRVEDPGPGLPAELTVREGRPQPRGWLLRVEELPDRTTAEHYGGRYLTLPRSELREPGADEFFLHDLLDLRVEDEAGTELGVVEAVYEAPGGVLLGVRQGEGSREDEASGEGDGAGERLVPFRTELVLEVDLEARRMRVRIPEGLLDL